MEAASVQLIKVVSMAAKMTYLLQPTLEGSSDSHVKLEPEDRRPQPRWNWLRGPLSAPSKQVYI